MIALAGKIINALFLRTDASHILLGIIVCSIFFPYFTINNPPPPPRCHIIPFSRVVHMPFPRLHDALHNSYAFSTFRSFSEAYILPMQIPTLELVMRCMLYLYAAKRLLVAEYSESYPSTRRGMKKENSKSKNTTTHSHLGRFLAC